jgi:hypothetical protein
MNLYNRNPQPWLSELRSLSKGIAAASVILAMIPFAREAVAGAGDTESEHRMTMYAARDLCTGPIATFANTPDPESAISYDAGEFKIIRAKGSITIMKNGVEVEKLAKFDYSAYADCIKNLTAGTMR